MRLILCLAITVAFLAVFAHGCPGPHQERVPAFSLEVTNGH